MKLLTAAANARHVQPDVRDSNYALGSACSKDREQEAPIDFYEK